MFVFHTNREMCKLVTKRFCLNIDLMFGINENLRTCAIVRKNGKPVIPVVFVVLVCIPPNITFFAWV